MSSVSVWEGIFMLVVLKIPMVYLAAVVWWAIRAEPHPDDGGEGARTFVPLTPCQWDEWRRRRSTPRFGHRPVGPRGRPALRRRASRIAARRFDSCAQNARRARARATA